jgi:hypothetical protein
MWQVAPESAMRVLLVKIMTGIFDEEPMFSVHFHNTDLIK